MTYKLVVEERHFGWVICWHSDGETGAAVGEGNVDASLEALDARGEREWLAAEIAAGRLRPEPWRRDYGVFWWDSHRAATRALKEIKTTMKALLGNTPWPGWAIKAHAAGWTAPKGWKP